MTMTRDQSDVLDILARHAQRPARALEPACEMADIGIDSLKFIMVVLDIEQHLNRRVFDVGNVGGLRTVGDLIELVAPA